MMIALLPPSHDCRPFERTSLYGLGGGFFSMKYIPLTQGRQAIVDDDDYEALKVVKWYVSSGYAVRSVASSGPRRQVVIRMHRLIACAPDGIWTDHINGNRLDNRKCNLRICTPAENNRNVGKRKHNTSGYKGVSMHIRNHCFTAQIRVHGTLFYLGSFSTAAKAHEAYKAAVKIYHGEFARTK